MFDNKNLLYQPVTKTGPTNSNAFLQEATMVTNLTLSDKGGLKYATSSNDFVDQFNNISNYRSIRSYQDIEKDAYLLYTQDKELALRFTMYLRAITRKPQDIEGNTYETLRGAEMRHEAITRMMWLAMYDREVFLKNLPLFVMVGSWKDVMVMLRRDLMANGWEDRKLPWNEIGELLVLGLNLPTTTNLVRKYLPTIKSKSNTNATPAAQANVAIGKWICSLLFGSKQSGNTYRQYRKLKSAGTGHTWQQVISRKEWDRLNFDTIHGRALRNLVKSKFLQNQGLSDRYDNWVGEKDTVKYTGFVHELFRHSGPFRRSVVSGNVDTINKQFLELVRKGGDTETTELIVVRDTSGSMRQAASGETMSCGNIAKAIALYFSYFLKGHFSNNWIEFNRDAYMHEWVGSTPVEKWNNDHSGYIGTTNFQSVVDLFVRLKLQGVPESDFPKGILCISDSEFDPSSLSETNVQTVRRKLSQAGFSEEYCNNFIIVLWNLGCNYRTETSSTATNTFYFSGYSASTMGLLTSEIKNAEQLFHAAMYQEALNLVTV